MSILTNQVHFNGQFTICTLLKVLRRVAVLYPEPNTVLVKVVGYLRVQLIRYFKILDFLIFLTSKAQIRPLIIIKVIFYLSRTVTFPCISVSE